MKIMFQNNHLLIDSFTYEDCHSALCQYRKESKHTPFFISGWDVDESVMLPHALIKNIIPAMKQNVNEYFLVEDDSGRSAVSKYLKDKLNLLFPTNQIMIGGSATALICLVLLSLISNTDNEVLILEPSYFSIHDTLNLTHHPFQSICISIPQFSYNYELIEDIIQKRNVKILIVTDPIFGSGIPIKETDYKQLITLANQYNCTLLVDMARMGLRWDNEEEPIIGECLSIIRQAKQYAVIYSPCKKVFANGAKTGILVSSENIMNQLSIYSDSVLGSISSLQEAFLNTLLLSNNKNYISQQILANTALAKKRYDILTTLVNHSNCSLIQPQMGHYALMTYPTNGNTEWEIFMKILKEAGVYTLPMGLYGFHEASSYLFRVNLLSKLDDLVNGIESIIFTSGKTV